MFTVGKRYTLKFAEGDNTIERPSCVVVETEGTVVKFRQAQREFIVNTASVQFVSAEPEDI